MEEHSKRNLMNSQGRRELAAPCGLYCGACSIYVARERGDQAALKAVAKRIAQLRGWILKPEEDLVCDGLPVITTSHCVPSMYYESLRYRKRDYPLCPVF